jgi:uncharacterized repeat protein (TIGR01451 family)
MTVTARLNAVSGLEATVPFTTGGTATPGVDQDYTITPSPVEIPAGQLTADIIITVNDDALVEPDETVVVTLGTPTNAIAGTYRVHTATIIDDDQPPTYTLTVNLVGNGSVIRNPVGPVYDEGTVVTLTAIPDADWGFVGWSGDLSGSNNPETITMSSEKSVTATFAENLAKLSLNKTASTKELFAGSSLVYALVVGNSGGPARHLIVTDALPANTTFASCDCVVEGWTHLSELLPFGLDAYRAPCACGLEEGQVIGRVSEMAGGRAMRMTFGVSVGADLPDGTLIVNDYYAAVADGLAPLVGHDPVTTTVRQLRVTIAKTAWPNPVVVGQQLWFTITLRNDGDLLRSLLVTDILPNGVSFVSCGGALCQIGGDDGRDVSWFLSTLPGASERQLTLCVSVDGVETGTLVNAFYGVLVPAASRTVMGAPVEVQVISPSSLPYHFYLPTLLAGTASINAAQPPTSPQFDPGHR